MKPEEIIRIISNIVQIKNNFKGSLTEEEEFFVEYSNTITSLLEEKVLHNYTNLCKTYNEVCTERDTKPKLDNNGNIIGRKVNKPKVDTAAAMGVAMASTGIFDEVVGKEEATVANLATVEEDFGVGDDVFLSEEELEMLNV